MCLKLYHHPTDSITVSTTTVHMALHGKLACRSRICCTLYISYQQNRTCCLSQIHAQHATATFNPLGMDYHMPHIKPTPRSWELHPLQKWRMRCAGSQQRGEQPMWRCQAASTRDPAAQHAKLSPAGFTSCRMRRPWQRHLQSCRRCHPC